MPRPSLTTSEIVQLLNRCMTGIWQWLHQSTVKERAFLVTLPSGEIREVTSGEGHITVVWEFHAYRISPPRPLPRPTLLHAGE